MHQWASFLRPWTCGAPSRDHLPCVLPGMGQLCLGSCSNRPLGSLPSRALIHQGYSRRWEAWYEYAHTQHQKGTGKSNIFKCDFIGKNKGWISYSLTLTFQRSEKGKEIQFCSTSEFSLSRSTSPGPEWPQAYSLTGPDNLVLGETGSCETAERTQMHNFSGKTCLSCKEPPLLSSLFQFPVWVKHRASPNLVLSWKSIQENKQKEDWLDVSFSQE